MKLIKYLFGAAVFLCSMTSSATILNFEYQFDGTSLTPAAGFPNLFGTSLAVGDTVNLKYKAVGAASYWNFSGVGSSEGNVNLGFEYPGSCGTRSSHGGYTASLNGAAVLSNTYSVGGQSCIHLGPNFIDFSGVSQIDEFLISYSMDSSSAPANIIGSYANQTWWQVWELFNGSGAPFVYVADPAASVPEPASIVLLGLGFAALGFARRKMKS